MYYWKSDNPSFVYFNWEFSNIYTFIFYAFSPELMNSKLYLPPPSNFKHTGELVNLKLRLDVATKTVTMTRSVRIVYTFILINWILLYQYHFEQVKKKFTFWECTWLSSLAVRTLKELLLFLRWTWCWFLQEAVVGLFDFFLNPSISRI